MGIENFQADKDAGGPKSSIEQMTDVLDEMMGKNTEAVKAKQKRREEFLEKKRQKEAKKPPPIEILEKNEKVEIIEREFGDNGWVREYVNKNTSEKNLRRVLALEYVTTGGQRLNFNDLLPEGYDFYRIAAEKELDALGTFSLGPGRLVIYSESFAVAAGFDDKGELILHNRNFFEQPGALLYLLHEIGHAYEKKSLLEELYIIWLRRRSHPSRKHIFKERFVQSRIENIYQPERNAWAYALRKLRELRRDSIDIAPKLDTKEKILAAVNDNLRSYEETTKQLIRQIEK